MGKIIERVRSRQMEASKRRWHEFVRNQEIDRFERRMSAIQRDQTQYEAAVEKYGAERVRQLPSGGILIFPEESQKTHPWWRFW